LLTLEAGTGLGFRKGNLPPGTKAFFSHSAHMGSDLELNLAEADEAMRTALSLARAQEARVAQMRAQGLDARDAEALLAAYRHGVHLAVKRKCALEASLQRTLRSRRSL